jgi:hypothetical protein
MWLALTDTCLFERFIESSIYEQPGPLVDVLEALQTRDYASELAAVTSLGQLWLTPLLEYSSTEGVPTISIGLEHTNNIIVTYSPGHLQHEKAPESAQSLFGTASQAAEHIDLLMFRLQHEILEKTAGE